MPIEDIKKSIIIQLEDINDLKLLKAIKELIDFEKAHQTFKIAEKYLKSLEKSDKDESENKFYTLEEFEKKYEKWLKG